MALLEATDDTVQLARGYLWRRGIESSEKRADETRDFERTRSACRAPRGVADIGMLRIGQSRLSTLEGDGRAGGRDGARRDHDFGDSHGDEQGARAGARSAWRCKGDVGTGRRNLSSRDRLLTVHGRRQAPARCPLNGPAPAAQGRGDEAEPILRRAYDLGVAPRPRTHQALTFERVVRPPARTRSLSA